MKKTKGQRTTMRIFLLLLISAMSQMAWAQYVHPGGLHTQADLDRMKTQVAAGAHPWIDDWNLLITDPLAQNTYVAASLPNMGSNRQRADKDAHAAYLNAIRWYVSGDTSYADCAVRILNTYATTVNQVPTGTDIPGLIGIAIQDFALAGEVLRIYPGWVSSDFTAFQDMFTNYLYPVVNDFLTNHNGACISHYWANWDAANIGALIAMGVLNDNTSWFNQGVSYYQSGPGNGAIMNAVSYVFPGNLGQWQEAGRDQEHDQLGVGLLGYAAQTAWNQGVDLFGYSSNRLLAGAEYTAQYNQWQSVPYTTYNNCDNVQQYYIATNGRGRLDDRPVWELIYNHYAVLQSGSAPNSQAMAQLMRPEHGSADHFGYGTLTFTLNAASSPYPPSPVSAAPTGLMATAGVGLVYLDWTPASTATGYNVLRATTSGGPYTSIASLTQTTGAHYKDAGVTNGTTYYYVVQAANQSGTSANSAEASGTPMASGALPAGWADADVGSVNTPGSASYATVGSNTFLVAGQGSSIGGTNDSLHYAYESVTGDFTLIARLTNVSGTSLNNTGVMMRETLNANATTVTMVLGSTGWRIAAIGTRSSTGGSMTWVTGNQYTWIPVWFRLQRSGNTFTASQSSDGVTWFTVGTSTVTMAGTYYVGLAACSGNATVVETSTFDNVGSGPPTIPPAPAGLTATAGNAQVSLTWNSSSGATSYNVKRATVSGGPYTTIASPVSTSYTDTGLTNGTTYYYVVSAVNSAGESANSAQVSATPQLPPPTAPTGLSATAGNAQVSLSWNASSGATSYNVKRATVSGGPYSVIASPTSTSFTDTGVTNGTTYYYVVSAVNSGGESANSAEVNATPTGGTGGLPSGWSDRDIGSVGIAGSATYNSGTFTVNGGGADIWGTSDAFNYASKSLTGNATITARVASQQSTNAWAKSGVMVRETTAANSKYVFMFVSPGNGVSLQYRSSTGGSAAQAARTSGPTAPYWVRLVRSGNTFTGYASSNGSSWTQVGSVSVTMATSVQEGLAVTAHDNTKLNTSTFDNVTVP